ncbi:MAG: hypothetical protein U9O86_09695 [Campylobacterota bacterium]|nr:hypothetical protein [Campylobacterota bacterium]
MQTNKDGGLRLYKQFGLFSLICLLLTSPLFAESFEDFKKSQNSSFSKYRDERDAAFNSYLKAQWEEYTAKESKPLYEKQKPKSISPSVEKKIKGVGPRINIKIAKAKPVVKPKAKELVTTIPQIIKTTQKPKVIPVVTKLVEPTRDVNFVFFGQKVGFDIDDKLKTAKFYPQNQSGISNFFDVAASSDYGETVRQIKTSAKALELNDWGVYLLVNQLSSNVFSNKDDTKLYSWFLFNKLGYEVKVGLGGKHVVLMHYSKKIIYSTPNYSFKKKKFYVISNYAKGSAGKVYTYKQSYPGASKALDLELQTLPNFEKDLQKKTVSFKQLGKEYKASYHYDKNLIDFMATYPQADYDTYFNAPMSEETYRDIAQDLKKYVDAKQASVAINFVLNFVQKAFKYERDQQQFGREKVMFANETLYYDKSDCEDRSILFSYLVKELFGVGVIGVKYKDHMATALYIPIKGDSVIAGKREFVIADPTYINANIGQSMPQYKSKIPQSFIVVRKDNER